MTKSAISHQLHVLKQSKLIRSRRDGIMALHLWVREEETFLEVRFGGKYLEYKKKTERYFIFL